ncbi:MULTISPECIES: cytochrome P450 [Nocardia]|uniref:cytochrome P450 n=1 Tax=Nocardia TaxID=1817 RepID=UPI001E3717F6|nr:MULTISPECIES: cytochrome P450 [Nocardia]
MITAAARHEFALHGAAQPALPLVLNAGALVRPMRKVPMLGWLVADPELAREIHSDGNHFSLVGEGASGHWWAQMLGDFVYHRFEGPGHTEFRAALADMFTPARSRALVDRAVGPMLEALTADLHAGRSVDIGPFAREYTGRIMADIAGIPISADDGTAQCLALFDTVERMADQAKGIWATTTVGARVEARGRDAGRRLSAAVPEVYATAAPDTVIGRCREFGLGIEETRGITTLMLVAGTATLASTLGRMVALLHDTGAVRELVADRSLIPAAVREALRVTSSMPIVGRGVTADVTLGGHDLHAGDKVKIMTLTINNELGGYDLHLGKVPHLRQLWFGGGRHLCLGAALTHVQLTRVLEALLAVQEPWIVSDRRYRRNVFVPMYERLTIRRERAVRTRNALIGVLAPRG